MQKKNRMMSAQYTKNETIGTCFQYNLHRLTVQNFRFRHSVRKLKWLADSEELLRRFLCVRVCLGVSRSQLYSSIWIFARCVGWCRVRMQRRNRNHAQLSDRLRFLLKVINEVKGCKESAKIFVIFVERFIYLFIQFLLLNQRTTTQVLLNKHTCCSRQFVWACDLSLSFFFSL